MRTSLTETKTHSNRFYEPYARENFKPPTVHGYTKLWRDSLCPRVGEIRLRDFKTVDAANFLTVFAAKGWGRRSLQHAKSLLSGIFTYAKNLGVLDGINPVQGTLIPRKAAAPAETHATTPEEVLTILEVLEKAKDVSEHKRIQVQVAIGLVFFAGLRPGEARGGKITTAKFSPSNKAFGGSIQPILKPRVPRSPYQLSNRCASCSQSCERRKVIHKPGRSYAVI